MQAIEAVTTPGETAALCQSVGVSRASLYRRRRPAPPATPPRHRARSPRALGATERQAVLDVLHSARFVDQSPTEVHATLLEEQTYLCSPRTMYRVLAADEVRERRAQSGLCRPRAGREAKQVWSWDITKLKGPVVSLLLALCEPVQRYVVGWMVARHENAHLAPFITPHQLTIHADRGAPMTQSSRCSSRTWVSPPVMPIRSPKRSSGPCTGRSFRTGSARSHARGSAATWLGTTTRTINELSDARRRPLRPRRNGPGGPHRTRLAAMPPIPSGSCTGHPVNAHGGRSIGRRPSPASGPSHDHRHPGRPTLRPPPRIDNRPGTLVTSVESLQ